MSDKPLVILHGWSDSWESFQNLARFFARETNRRVEIVKLADWLSLDDEVTYHDLAEGMQREWRAKKLPETPRSVDIVVHSTGALVLREWMTRFYTSSTNPVQNLLMLAPANFGSPLAHKGRAFYGRIIKGWRTGFQTGTKILKGLELGAAYTWELAERDILSSTRWYGKNGVMATILIGNTGYGGVRAAANEDGSDGTVRISSANLNAARLEVDFSQKPETPTYSLKEPRKEHQTAFAVLQGENHGSIIMKSDDTPRNKRARDLFKRAVSVKPEEWESWCSELEKLCEAYNQTTSWRKNSEHHLYQDTVVRISDDLGNPVTEYFVEFFEHNSNTSSLGRYFHREIIRGVHRHADDKQYRNMCLDVSLLYHRIAKPDVGCLEISIHAEPQFESNARVGYSKDSCTIKLDADQVKHVFQPNRTLLVDIIIKREMRAIFRILDTPQA